MRTLSTVAVFAALSLAAATQGAQLLDFKTSAITGGKPEFQFTNGSFSPGLGSDSSQSVGLLVEVPFLINNPAVAGQSITTSNTTQFSGATFAFTSPLSAVGPASTVEVLPSLYSTGQAIGTGSFTLTASDGTLLLSGSLGYGVIGGITGSPVASYQTNSITYTGGLLKSFIGSGAVQGAASISLNDLSPTLAVDSETNYLANFTANATGLFSYVPVPEPTGSAAALSTPFLLMLRRKSRA